jgi:hypothetical protein
MVYWLKYVIDKLYYAVLKQFASYFYFSHDCTRVIDIFDVVGWFLVFNATFTNIMATSFSDGRSRSTTDNEQVTGKLYHLRCESSAPYFVIYKAGRAPIPYW